MIEPRSLLKNVSRALTNTENRIGKGMRLDHNERTTPLPEKIVQEVWKTISPEELVAYPALEGLYRKLAKSLGVPREMLLLTSGSDTGIRMVFDTYVNPGDEVISLNPSYGMFAVYGDMFGAKKNFLEYNIDFSLPANRITDKINSKTKLVILADPNHTGTAMLQQDIISVIEKAAKVGALVLVDEAYHYFYEKTMMGFISRFDNLIIARSLSKAFGIAALRVGYLVSREGNIQNLYKVKLTHDITSVSAKFTEYFLDYPAIAKEYVKDVNEGKEYLTREFSRIGGHVFSFSD